MINPSCWVLSKLCTIHSPCICDNIGFAKWFTKWIKEYRDSKAQAGGMPLVMTADEYRTWKFVMRNALMGMYEAISTLSDRLSGALDKLSTIVRFSNCSIKQQTEDPIELDKKLIPENNPHGIVFRLTCLELLSVLRDLGPFYAWLHYCGLCQKFDANARETILTRK